MVLFKLGWMTNMFARSSFNDFMTYIAIGIPINIVFHKIYQNYLDGQIEKEKQTEKKRLKKLSYIKDLQRELNI